MLFLLMLIFQLFFEMNFLFGLNPYLLLAYVVFLISLACYFYGSSTNNVSQVDRLWSILPIFYVWAYTYISELSPVVILMAICVSLWGLRLTLNFYVRGGYEMKDGVFIDEDYRWGILRKAITNPILWDTFHLFFICFFQLYLIAGFTTPVLFVAMMETKQTIVWEDYWFFGSFLVFLVVEAIADHSMNVFQNAKYALPEEERAKSEDLRIVAGFNFTGFYKYSRHPNYFCEVMQWVVIYLWGSFHLGTWKNWGLLFVCVLAIIVFSSTFVCEPHSLSKYPLYREYQKVTSRFIPFFTCHYREFIEIVKKKQELCVCYQINYHKHFIVQNYKIESPYQRLYNCHSWQLLMTLSTHIEPKQIKHSSDNLDLNSKASDFYM